MQVLALLVHQRLFVILEVKQSQLMDHSRARQGTTARVISKRLSVLQDIIVQQTQLSPPSVKKVSTHRIRINQFARFALQASTVEMTS